ncbi:MAG: hypothetical protein JXB15_01295 [Anaerolineales bacterium]|nr:hypothetical protein [Anaerolineales bacterium]
MTAKHPCPVCGQTDLVEKASSIYLAGLLGQKAAGGAGEAQPPAKISPWVNELSPTERRALGKRLAPPASGQKLPARPIHPDQAVIAFSLVTPIFLYGMWNTQRALLLPALFALAVFFGFYFWKRKTILARYIRQLEQRKVSDERTRRGIERWMKLYYCARDDVVYFPGSSESTPADQLPGLLMRNISS